MRNRLQSWPIGKFSWQGTKLMCAQGYGNGAKGPNSLPEVMAKCITKPFVKQLFKLRSGRLEAIVMLFIYFTLHVILMRLLFSLCSFLFDTTDLENTEWEEVGSIPTQNTKDILSRTNTSTTSTISHGGWQECIYYLLVVVTLPSW